MTPALKVGFIAEMRFLRALVYFEMVKRMGGVPLVTTTLTYDFSGDPSPLQFPRNTEAEVYDFIASELDAIADQLGNAGSQTRANRSTALALKSRAMLYAGSLARHNSEMPNPITLPGEVVGIPASRAAEYYQKSLDASRQLIASGTHRLYQGNAHLGENFYEAVSKKTGNPEVILAKDYSAAAGRTHNFTRSVIPYTLRQDVVGTIGGSSTSPTLQLVESFDRLNGAPGTFTGVGDGSNTAAGQANWVYHDRIDDIFTDRDARLYGTVLYPGSSFAGEQLELITGVYEWVESAGRYNRVVGLRGTTHTDGQLLTGRDGPIVSDAYSSTTGFLLRKYLDPAPGARSSSVDSDMWWVLFRLGEVYLNAAEAAFELGLQQEALGYINTLRVRAGFPANSLTTLTRDKIRSERRVELAFEDHRLWDIIRWRIAHELWDGTPASLTANSWSLYPYRIVRPGHANHGKFVYDKIRSQRQNQPRNFRMGNYYSQISSGTLNANPKLIRNPFH
jgi:starch-binding outer membrane protein, SusD/RagB family